ncbi:MAG: hypothetical protein MMC23_003481 [Stictis urceolatum]|nr:hypothetical protein [Stictis urceolata]
MKLWQKKGWARYRLHVRVFREGQPVRIWRRVTIPLQYIHTLELDIHSRGTAFFSRALLPVEVHKLVLDFFEYGPELALPHKPKFWPLVDTVVINIGSLDSDHAVHTGPDIELDDPREASMPALIRAAVTDILYSYHFDELRNFLGYYLRTMQVRYEGYVFERLVEPDPPEAVIDTAF